MSNKAHELCILLNRVDEVINELDYLDVGSKAFEIKINELEHLERLLDYSTVDSTVIFKLIKGNGEGDGEPSGCLQLIQGGVV